MKTKNRSSYSEDFVSTKKKHSKCHDRASRQSKQFDTGVVADSLGRLINVGSWVSFPHNQETIEGEVIEIHPENKITVVCDDLKTEDLLTYKISAWDATIV